MFCLVFEKIKIKMLEVGTSKAESKLRPGLMCPVLTRVLMSFTVFEDFKDPHAKAAPLRNEKGVSSQSFWYL